MNDTDQITPKVVKFVQELLLDETDKAAVTPSLISEKIEMVLRMNPKWRDGLDTTAAIDELIRRFSLWIGSDTTIKDDVGHESWLNADRKRQWRYWQRYREWLERHLSYRAVDALDHSTDTVLDLLEDPERDGYWDRRGLVVGHVQSGKTSNYTGLICKAADAGYKIIIVLAGLHNNLRSQTQIRLDEGFLGYESSVVRDDIRPVGVGMIDADPLIRPNYATNRSDKGDFNTAIARHLGITPEQRPWLFVVKKNKTVLDRLHHWIRNHVANAENPESGRRIVNHLPLLLIDDEADHASVDTGEQVFDADGNPDDEHQPTAINSRIRRILHSFARSAYVGYTATPFANIFIHERGATRDEGPDLFPSAFIINLAAPSDYIGPLKLFGVQGVDGREGALPLFRAVTDHFDAEERHGWMPDRHRNGHIPLYAGQDIIPPSLAQAIDAFILACAVRRLRGNAKEHVSMLIHVTRFTVVQKNVHRQVEEHVRHMRQRLARRIDDEQIVARMHDLWLKDFVPTGEQVKSCYPTLLTQPSVSWKDVQGVLPDVVSEIEVRIINGTAKDALDYSEHSGNGLKVIAIGGDKLARGLTLEGLCVSYFLRSSKMYDTLMQMGRWFGYRPNYLDVCRLYTTSDLAEWFAHITDAAEELREEFELMAAAGATPKEYGLKVQSHPVLMVTSRLKMRTARNLLLSFSGQLLETVSLYRDLATLRHNVHATDRLLSELDVPSEIDPTRTRNATTEQWKGYLWNGVAASTVIAFLAAYKTHPEAYKVNSLLLAQFIESMARSGELTSWTVALMAGGKGRRAVFGNGMQVDLLQRTANAFRDDRYPIGRLLSPRDESIDLDEAAWNAALKLTKDAWRSDPARLKESEPDAPSGPAIRKVRGFGCEGVEPHPERGVLLLYPLDPEKAGPGIFLPDTPPVIGFGVSFPGSNSGTKVEYKVNNVLWEQEYGPAE